MYSIFHYIFFYYYSNAIAHSRERDVLCKILDQLTEFNHRKQGLVSRTTKGVSAQSPQLNGGPQINFSLK